MKSSAQSTRVKPPALRPGDKIGIVAPASNIKRDALDRGCQALRRLGYKPIYSESSLERDLYFAGSVKRRAQELEEMFVRDDVRAIICARGGYGSNYLLDKLDLKKVGAHPKIFAAYSDLTCLLTWFADSGKFVTFHAPMVTKDFASNDGVDLESWMAALTGISQWGIGAESGARPLSAGKADGTLYGGCLSILVSSLGTPYEIQTEGTILFLEDVAAKPFQIDRMLMQLKFAGKLAGVRGIVFGEMIDCRQTATQDYSLEEVVIRVLGGLKIPIAFGLRSGHVSRSNVTLPIGVQAQLEVGDTVTLRILESATSIA